MWHSIILHNFSVLLCYTSQKRVVLIITGVRPSGFMTSNQRSRDCRPWLPHSVCVPESCLAREPDSKQYGLSLGRQFPGTRIMTFLITRIYLTALGFLYYHWSVCPPSNPLWNSGLACLTQLQPFRRETVADRRALHCHVIWHAFAT